MELVAPDSPPHSLLDLPPEMAPEMASLQQDNASVFSTPTPLPPSRMHDHTIPLVEGFAPVNTTKKIVKYDSYLEYKMAVMTVIFYTYGGYKYHHISCRHIE